MTAKELYFIIARRLPKMFAGEKSPDGLMLESAARGVKPPGAGSADTNSGELNGRAERQAEVEDPP
jgi:hypothetical protein